MYIDDRLRKHVKLTEFTHKRPMPNTNNQSIDLFFKLVDWRKNFVLIRLKKHFCFIINLFAVSPNANHHKLFKMRLFRPNFPSLNYTNSP